MSVLTVLVDAALVGLGGLAVWLFTRTRTRIAVLEARNAALQTALGRVDTWMRYLTAHVDKADLRQDRRMDYLMQWVRGLLDTVQVPALRVVGGDPASVSLPAQANRDKRERESNVTPIGPQVADDFDRAMEWYMRGLADKEEPPPDEEPPGEDGMEGVT